MTVLVAPDSFKGTYSAAEVAAAISEGINDGGGCAVQLPVADGGEGTFDALCRSLQAAAVSVDVVNSWGEPLRAVIGLTKDGNAVVEVAQAGGLTAGRITPHDAVAASTYGTGMMIVAAVALGAKHIFVAAGGSATTDGGAGAVQAIIDGGGLHGARITVLTDVTTSFLDAPRVFGPQKGADPAAVEALEERLAALAASSPRNPAGVPRTGAAGGLSGGLWAYFEAELVSGADAVLDAAGFDSCLASADAVVVGEGRLDSQTGEGKIISAILERVQSSGRKTPVIAVVGSLAEDLGDYAENFAAILLATDATAMRAAGREIARG
ncbi:Glycerate kinase [Pseudarthrobacter chlorophenolicus A6]|uniref:Glycerate kinase n=1 Tax=Pseudarthrobacter chlorophenolicus (strain ATCC 700700 / DSM 12829 / CIP 107037 / JCM 12360 / KCTC 9906 / NCIMB 13794 / A6) TaxID=452863 RepID=B8H937_PSECP|nr:glycerate kinase [Pseudarthrobacter chlorophenolicus]ACL38196.1 Glycerate kinase [Pseudarthrobacter chlorophenolicus A6]SDQ53585.1 glycerate kinase [Pseudarthrobacter chlorophenolicus]